MGSSLLALLCVGIAGQLHAHTIYFPLHTYETGRLLGVGNQGRVYAAKDERGKLYAIKSRSIYNASDQERSFNICSQFAHPNIIKCYEWTIQGDLCWIVLEHVQGTALTELKLDIYDPQIALNLGFQYLDALEYVTQKGFFHRDLMRQNIMVDNKMRLKLIDLEAFGTLDQSTSHPIITHEVYLDKVSTKLMRIFELGTFKRIQWESITYQLEKLAKKAKYKTSLSEPVTPDSARYIINYIRDLKEIVMTYLESDAKARDNDFWE